MNYLSRMAWKVSPFNAREYHIRKLFKGKSQSQACNIAFYNLTRQPPTINVWSFYIQREQTTQIITFSVTMPLPICLFCYLPFQIGPLPKLNIQIRLPPHDVIAAFTQPVNICTNQFPVILEHHFGKDLVHFNRCKAVKAVVNRL